MQLTFHNFSFSPHYLKAELSVFFLQNSAVSGYR
ncbi:hypothetical protein V6Z11_D10G116200 [Gossypium hirsutum]